MALKPVYVDVSLSGGLDAKQDRKVIRAPATITADNVRYSTTGSVRKRYGINFINQPSSNNVQTLGSTNDELIATDRSYMYSYRQTDNAWTNRGVAAQCAVGTQSLGGYQLPAPFGASDANVRGLTFEISNAVGLLAFDTGDNYDSGNAPALNYIQLVCFDANSGKAIWDTRITKPFVKSNAQLDILTAGVQTPSAYGPSGCAHPLIRLHNGIFYLAFIKAGTGVTQNSGTGSYPSYVYSLDVYRLGDSNSIRTQIPSITQSSYNNCTKVEFTSPTGIGPAAARQFNSYATPQGVPLWYDMTSNGRTLWLSLCGTYFGMKPGDSVSIGGSGYQSYALQSNSATYFTQQQATTLPNGIYLGHMACSHTPANSDGTYPPDASFTNTFAHGTFAYVDPAVNSNINRGTYFFNPPTFIRPGPISTRLLGSTGAWEMYATDGLNYQRLKLDASGSWSLIKSGGIQVDYALNFGNLINQAAKTTGPFLQSRIFLAPDGQPVVWVMLQLYDNTNFNCLALVNVGDAVTPANSVYAHAFYLRTGAALYGRFPCNVVNNSILAFQITDKANLTGVISRISINAEPYPSVCRLYQGALITGGDTKYYDGKSCRTMGWLKFPEAVEMSKGIYCTGTKPVALGYPSNVPPTQGWTYNQPQGSARNAPFDPAKTNNYSSSPTSVPGNDNFSAVEFFLVPLVAAFIVPNTLVSTHAYSYIFVYVDFDSYGNAIYSSPSNPIYLSGTNITGAPAGNGFTKQKTFPATLGTTVVSQAQSYLYLKSGTNTVNGVTSNYQIQEIYKLYDETYANTPYLAAQYGDILNPTRGKCLVFRNSSLDVNNYHLIPPLTYIPALVSTPAIAAYTDYYPGADIQQPYQPTSRGTITTAAGYYDLSPDDNTQNPLIYSQPAANNTGASGELPNDPPPPSTFAVTTTRRPFIASAENRTWLYYGKPYYPGRAPEFNAGQFLEIDPPSGPITGLAVLDQNVIVFKRDRIFVLAGEGPDATGSGIFNNTYPVATDTGCIESASIVTTETGVYFRSVRGMQMIDRSLQVSYPGAIVERIVNASTITSAVLVPYDNQIRWALRSNDPNIAGTGADNVILVLDYLQNKWSQYRLKPGYDPAYSLRISGQTLYQNNYFASAGNSVFQDAGPYNTMGAQSFLDYPDRQVPMTVETGWIPLTGPQGWGRLRRVNVLGDFKGAHSLTLSFGYDYNEDYPYSVTYTPSSTAGNPGGISEATGIPGDAQNWRVRAPRQVAQAVRFKLVDNGSGEAVVITGLELETSQKSGATRVPDAQSV